ncbi:unnamed protein product, partial [Ectocarpus sp. 8 AP-2014]
LAFTIFSATYKATEAGTSTAAAAASSWYTCALRTTGPNIFSRLLFPSKNMLQFLYTPESCSSRLCSCQQMNNSKPWPWSDDAKAFSVSLAPSNSTRAETSCALHTHRVSTW